MRSQRFLYAQVAVLIGLAALLAACAPAAQSPAGPALAQSMPLPALAPAVADSAAGEPDEAAVAPAEPAALAEGQAALPAEPPESCPVTTTPEQPFAPPAPWPAAAPYAGHFWYGSAALWTMLMDDGVWRGLDSSGYGQKVVFWREGYFWKAEPEPPLTVTARRLDAEGVEARVLGATNGYHADVESFMLAGVEFGGPGCWEVTGQYGEAALSFVVWVAP